MNLDFAKAHRVVSTSNDNNLSDAWNNFVNHLVYRDHPDFFTDLRDRTILLTCIGLVHAMQKPASGQPFFYEAISGLEDFEHYSNEGCVHAIRELGRCANLARRKLQLADLSRPGSARSLETAL